MLGLYERFSDWRNRLLAAPKFQNWAASFPLTRPIARARAREIFDLTAGFVYSQVLFACVELEVFSALRNGALSVPALSNVIGLPEAGTDRLARAAASLRLLERRGDRYALGPYGAALLGNPSVFAMIRHHAALYSDLKDPVALLRERSQETSLAKFWNYGDGDSSEYSTLMAATQEFIAEEILSAYSFEDHSHVMDVGGGAGAFLRAVKSKHPSLKATLCDLPHVVAIALENFAKNGNDVEVVECDFQKQELPQGADIITLIRILHDHDVHVVSALLSAIHEKLPKEGTLLIAEPMADTPGVAPMGEAYFGMYLWAMGSGRPRSFRELAALLESAGFASAKLIPTRRPILTQLIVAKKRL